MPCQVAVVVTNAALVPPELRDRPDVLLVTPKTALREVALCAPRVIVAAISGPDDDATMEAAAAIRSRLPHLPVLMLVHQGTESVAVAALRAGVKNYFRAPHEMHELLRACEDSSSAEARAGSDEMIGASAPVQDVKALLKRIAAADTNLLITGETGTGKELAARFVHANSRRHSRQIVSLNCAAIPDSLLESELFGYAKGAFTGAAGRTSGKLEIAHEGTIFFDEVGDMSVISQSKILRVIDTRDVYPLGTHRPIRVDVRIVAATNQDLERKVRDGLFRADLLYRLNVAHVHMPPLRERREDIPLLLRHYVTVFGRMFARPGASFSSEALELLTHYEWPGNIRELRNVVERQFLYSESDVFAISTLPPCISMCAPNHGSRNDRERILQALADANWNKSKAAATLHWSRMTLYRKLARMAKEPSRESAGPTGAACA
jgi:DNA-binding NtrC family response regulator